MVDEAGDIPELATFGVLIARSAVQGNGDGASPVGGRPRRIAESIAAVPPVPTAAGQRGPLEAEAVACARRGSVVGGTSTVCCISANCAGARSSPPTSAVKNLLVSSFVLIIDPSASPSKGK
ncbi:hypothetical protein SVIO_009280 [Streptomyces violaceusniger]|uniref:Uncharacterized protein n=1 Tax=Streptomyces violaceusniger TaxID=68280 RepID=A0A4D4KN19_STRVO|nr:hypothetical protein SVIO_009280 [Streptomyces violaceusniger]